MKRILITLALAIGILSTAGWIQSQPKPQTWEYKTVTGKAYDEKKLNLLGAEGWELASCAAGLDACIFKRAR